MKLVLMAGGKGVRLQPLTYDTPKPMLLINGKPILEHTIEWAKTQGITDIIICSGYLSNVIEKYFGDGSKLGVHIEYSVEKSPLGTGGPLRIIKEKLKEDFIVLSGDIVCKIDAKKLMQFHKKMKADATVVVQKGSHPEESDLIEYDKKGKVKHFWLKPHSAETPKIDKTNASMYVLSPKSLSIIPEGSYNLERQLLPELLKQGKKVYAYYTEEFLEDMGSFDRMKQIEEMMKTGKI
ncbi:MAG: nucleotidyltransferase family protein [Candidatus Nanoarchaeia archaeon]